MTFEKRYYELLDAVAKRSKEYDEPETQYLAPVDHVKDVSA